MVSCEAEIVYSGSEDGENLLFVINCLYLRKLEPNEWLNEANKCVCSLILLLVLAMC
jgi:hypothetical protein